VKRIRRRTAVSRCCDEHRMGSEVVMIIDEAIACSRCWSVFGRSWSSGVELFGVTPESRYHHVNAMKEMHRMG
jgi:hypothetical protein